MWNTIGHEWAVSLLKRGVEIEQIAHAYLFLGPTNIGKTHLALELAAALVCIGDVPPCGVCRACLRARQGIHPDVSLLEPQGSRFGISQVRELQGQLSLSPYEGRRRVSIITDFQLATSEAANALLKTLEEPPSRVVIILTATDASALLPTIISRCQVFFLRRVAREQIERALIERWNQPPELARVLAHLSAGRAGWAIRAAQDPSMLAERRQHIEELVRVLGQGRSERLQIAEALSQREDLPEILRLWQTWWRDILLVASGCDELTTNVDYAEILGNQAQRHGLRQAQAAICSIESTLQQLDHNVNARLALDVLLLGWPRGAQPA
ncbi:MAG: hypothetical protein A2Y73_00945 [Chloroflexi bacterium RBG_13_56_8]|nr:MAG: hypothetical protein A2Y73_00945 [Chloroflexi bacterium RBG_13_56_8]